MAFETDSEDDYVPPKDASDDGEDDELEPQPDERRRSRSRKKSASVSRRSRSRASSTSRPQSRSRASSKARSVPPTPRPVIRAGQEGGLQEQSKPLVLSALPWDSSEDDALDTPLRKRPAEDELDFSGPPRFKRQRGTFNGDYLDLLNRDIEDAATQAVLDDYANLAPEQLGLTVWTASEKAVFFEALSRCGRDNVSGIAVRLPSKSEVEIVHYLHILEGSIEAMTATHRLPWMAPASIPAALELGSQCCQVLEEAADAISLRQEDHERQMEEGKWGPDCWNITRPVARALLDQSSRDQMTERNVDFATLFELRNWLQLSGRIFMNGARPECNWRHVDDKSPSIWATAFEDLYSLAVSFTRRLVHTTLQCAESRARARRAAGTDKMGRCVKPVDVEAAIMCLGVAPNSRAFWARCPRRLGLVVVDDEEGEGGVDDEVKGEAEDADELDGMNYDSVERLLVENDEDGSEGVQDAYGVGDDEEGEEGGEGGEGEDDEEGEEGEGEEEEADSEDAASTQDEDTRQDDDDSILDDEDTSLAEQVRLDLKEALIFSATALPQTRKAHQGLKARIRSEIHQDRHADATDMAASRREETALFELLKLPAPVPLPFEQDARPKAVVSSSLMGNTLVRERGWREYVRVGFREEWEALEEGQRRGAAEVTEGAWIL